MEVSTKRPRQHSQCRAAWEQKQDLAADARWRTAVREAGDRLGAMTIMVGLADRWGREKAREILGECC